MCCINSLKLLAKSKWFQLPLEMLFSTLLFIQTFIWSFLMQQHKAQLTCLNFYHSSVFRSDRKGNRQQTDSIKWGREKKCDEWWKSGQHTTVDETIFYFGSICSKQGVGRMVPWRFACLTIRILQMPCNLISSCFFPDSPWFSETVNCVGGK